MANIYNRFRTNAQAETEGTWLNFGDGLRVKVRSTDATVVREYQAKLFKKNRQALSANGGILPPAVQDELDVDLLASVVIVGWEGVTDDKGQALEFNRANAVKVLRDLREFRKEIQYLAGLGETFRDAGFDEQLGNSQESSNPA
jgi:hypothetical protein